MHQCDLSYLLGELRAPNIVTVGPLLPKWKALTTIEEKDSEQSGTAQRFEFGKAVATPLQCWLARSKAKTRQTAKGEAEATSAQPRRRCRNSHHAGRRSRHSKNVTFAQAVAISSSYVVPIDDSFNKFAPCKSSTTTSHIRPKVSHNPKRKRSKAKTRQTAKGEAETTSAQAQRYLAIQEWHRHRPILLTAFLDVDRISTCKISQWE